MMRLVWFDRIAGSLAVLIGGLLILAVQILTFLSALSAMAMPWPLGPYALVIIAVAGILLMYVGVRLVRETSQR